MSSLIGYLRQPTSIAGLSAIFGTITGLLSGTIDWPTAVPIVVGALFAIILPDNSLAKTAATTLVKDAIAVQRSFVPGEATLTVVSGGTHTI